MPQIAIRTYLSDEDYMVYMTYRNTVDDIIKNKVKTLVSAYKHKLVHGGASKNERT